MNKTKKIDGFSNYYITSDGKLYRRDIKTGRIKKNNTTLDRNFYERVTMVKDGKLFNKFIHRLVAEAFIPNPENKPQVNHKNGNRSDNRVENLEWVTCKENIRYSYDILNRKGSRHNKFGINNPTAKVILQIKNGEIIAEFYGGKEAERKTGVSHADICRCCNNKRNKAGGYNWKYKKIGE